MPLWTDLITPAEATGYIRTALEDLEVNRPSLNRYLPSEFVNDISVRFRKGRAGFVTEAQFRAFDAEPEFAGSQTGQRVTVELPALGQQRAVSEYDQLRNRNAGDQEIRDAILSDLRAVAVAVFDRIERLRGTVITTGRATVAQDNFSFDDDFGRRAEHNTTATALWDAEGTVSRLEYLNTLMDLYSDSNDGTGPGVFLMSRKVYRSLIRGREFSLILADGTVRPGDLQAVSTLMDREGLPGIEIYDRSTGGGRVLPQDSLFLLPAPTSPTGESDLGRTYWGRTLTSMDSNYGLAAGEQPGVVAGAFKADRIPHIASVESDAIALPVLTNADLSLKAKVIA